MTGNEITQAANKIKTLFMEFKIGYDHSAGMTGERIDYECLEENKFDWGGSQMRLLIRSR